MKIEFDGGSAMSEEVERIYRKFLISFLGAYSSGFVYFAIGYFLFQNQLPA